MDLYKGIVYVFARDYDKAIKCLREYNDNASDTHGLRFLAYALSKSGKADEAREAIEWLDLSDDTDVDGDVEDLAKLFYLSGLDKKANERMEFVLKNNDCSDNYHYAAQFYATMGDVDKALDCLEKAYNGGWPSVLQDLIDPELEAIRNTPRFKKLAKDKLTQINPAMLKKVKI